MGLAASQARLLTITARKADCEFQSMSLSHQKIALSRDMERISDEYQNAMNLTKLVYDYYGTGTSQMSVNYGLFMSPSVYNDYYPKLITDNTNRVVLSGKYSDAAKKAGIPIEGYNGTPSSEVRNKFVEALRDNGTISAATAANIESVSYNNCVGLGATFSAQEVTQDVTYSDMLEMIKAYCADTQDYGLSFDFSDGSYLCDTSTYPNHEMLSWQLYDHNSHGYGGLYLEGEKGAANNLSQVSLYDLLTGNKDYILSITQNEEHSDNIPAAQACWMQQYLVGNENTASFLNWMVDQFSTILGGVTANELALQYAYDQVYDIIYPNEDLQNSWIQYGGDARKIPQSALETMATKVMGGYDCDNTSDVRNYATMYIGPVFNGCGSESCSEWDGGDDRQVNISVDLSKLTQVFLTAFVEYQEGIDHSSYSYEKGQTSNGDQGSTKYSLWEYDDDYIFKIAAPTDVDTGNSSLEAGFYDALFNMICVQGWTENDNITDAQYMQELLKSGAVFISNIDNDGCYYQNSYSTDTYISEVADTEQIAQAEAKYNAAKAKIENKENTIDMKMKNLDTEISSLTTEYDTMKSVISKSIEKSFKRYEA